MFTAFPVKKEEYTVVWVCLIIYHDSICTLSDWPSIHVCRGWESNNQFEKLSFHGGFQACFTRDVSESVNPWTDNSLNASIG